ncbi:xylanase A [Coprinopsis cinerea AmutBmut pab1-1]|nr:xylanase A [Coprinopsis cinerea AmutBmut pab1-1]
MSYNRINVRRSGIAQDALNELSQHLKSFNSLTDANDWLKWAKRLHDGPLFFREPTPAYCQARRRGEPGYIEPAGRLRPHENETYKYHLKSKTSPPTPCMREQSRAFLGSLSHRSSLSWKGVESSLCDVTSSHCDCVILASSDMRPRKATLRDNLLNSHSPAMKVAPFIALTCVVASALATPYPLTSAQVHSSNVGTPNSEGQHDGFFYSWWSDTGATANYTNEAGGRFSVNWWRNGTFAGGKGWNPGRSDRVLSYTGTYENENGDSLLALTGWARNRQALVQYYVVESYGVWNPTSGIIMKGNVTCDGATYDVGYTWRPNQISPDGITTSQQFWSVRRPKTPYGKVQGRIDFSCHVEGWKGFGMELGAHLWQIMAIDGYLGAGRATVEIM